MEIEDLAKTSEVLSKFPLGEMPTGEEDRFLGELSKVVTRWVVDSFVGQSSIEDSAAISLSCMRAAWESGRQSVLKGE